MTGRYVPLDTLAAAGDLTGDQKITAVSDALGWLGVAYGLVMIHGPKGAGRRLVEIGCPVRIDDRERVVVWVGGDAMNPADELRAAAAKLRDRGKDVTTGIALFTAARMEQVADGLDGEPYLPGDLEVLAAARWVNGGAS